MKDLRTAFDEVFEIAKQYAEAIAHVAEKTILGEQARNALTRLTVLRAEVDGVKPIASASRTITIEMDPDVRTSYASETVRIGAGMSCHIVTDSPISVHAMLARRRDGYVWLTNLHPAGAGVAVRPTGQPRITVTNTVVVLPGTIVTVANRDIRVVDC